MSDLNLMHYDQLDAYFNAVSETSDLEEIPVAEALVRSLMPSTLAGNPRYLPEKAHLRSDHRREAMPHDEQSSIQQRKTYTKVASSAVNLCKTDRHGTDFSWDMILPSVFDDKALVSRTKLHMTPVDDRERPQGNWNDVYSLSDDDGSRCGEQLSYCGSNEGNLYFTPTSADFPRSFVPPSTWILTIYNHPYDDEEDTLHGEEIDGNDDDEGHFYFTPTPADSFKSDSFKSFVPGILTIWDEP